MKPRLRIAIAYPLATQAQGDEGNAVALAHRWRLRGGDSDVAVVDRGSLPRADIVLIGGLDEDGLPDLAERLQAGGLREAVDAGAVVLAVNAGFVVLGRAFVDSGGATQQGLGLLDAHFSRGSEVTQPVVAKPSIPGVPTMSGYVSHRCVPHLGPHARPFARVQMREGTSAEGVVASRVIGTLLHGPLLARNALLADRLIERALGVTLEPAEEGWAGRVRRQRTAEDRADPSGWGGMRYGRPDWRGRLAQLRGR